MNQHTLHIHIKNPTLKIKKKALENLIWKLIELLTTDYHILLIWWNIQLEKFVKLYINRKRGNQS